MLCFFNVLLCVKCQWSPSVSSTTRGCRRCAISATGESRTTATEWRRSPRLIVWRRTTLKTACPAQITTLMQNSLTFRRSQLQMYIRLLLPLLHVLCLCTSWPIVVPSQPFDNSKVMVTVWRLRGHIISTVSYWQRATSSMATVNKNSSHSPVGPCVCLCVFWVAWFIFRFMYVFFYLGQLNHFPSCFGAGVTNLKEPPSSFLLPPYYCRLGAGSIPLRAIVNKKQCEMRGLFMSLVIHDWIGDVQDPRVYPPPKWPILCRVGRLILLTHSLTLIYSLWIVVVLVTCLKCFVIFSL